MKEEKDYNVVIKLKFVLEKHVLNHLNIVFGKEMFLKRKNTDIVSGKKEEEITIKEHVVNGQKFAKVIVEKEQEDVILQQKDVNGQEEQLELKKNKKCTKVHLEHGTRKRCCVYKKKCINYDRLTCKSKRKPKCWATRKCKYVGAYEKKIMFKKNVKM